MMSTEAERSEVNPLNLGINFLGWILAWPRANFPIGLSAGRHYTFRGL